MRKHLKPATFLLALLLTACQAADPPPRDTFDQKLASKLPQATYEIRQKVRKELRITLANLAFVEGGTFIMGDWGRSPRTVLGSLTSPQRQKRTRPIRSRLVVTHSVNTKPPGRRTTPFCWLLVSQLFCARQVQGGTLYLKREKESLTNKTPKILGTSKNRLWIAGRMPRTIASGWAN